MEYTKGEWKLNEENDIYVKNTCIVQVWGNSCDEARANAQLIASAPDLYEALKAIDGYLSASFPANLTRKKHAVELLDKALAKAEGK